MHSWEAIELSLNYIEEHLNETLETEHLADMVGLSPYYFQRLFKKPASLCNEKVASTSGISGGNI